MFCVLFNTAAQEQLNWCTEQNNHKDMNLDFNVCHFQHSQDKMLAVDVSANHRYVHIQYMTPPPPEVFKETSGQFPTGFVAPKQIF